MIRFSDEQMKEALGFARGDDVAMRHLGRFQLCIMSQVGDDDLKVVMEATAKEEFTHDPKECIDSMQRMERDVWGWQDWANHLSAQFVPSFGRPSWPNHK